MTSWTPYPKIYAVGHGAVTEIFFDPVVIEEKLDGSQISFGVFDGKLRIKSKSVEFDLEAGLFDKSFAAGVEVIKSLAPSLLEGCTYRGEYFAKPKHNALAYDRIPKNHIMGFDIATGPETYMTYEGKSVEFSRLGLETASVLYMGEIKDVAAFNNVLSKVSVLGGAKIEGVVVKNHRRFGLDGKPLLAKYVSEVFKEIHRQDWKDKNPSPVDLITRIGIEYTTEARWHKAVQHLKESGRLKQSPEDIGPLMEEVSRDILTECGDEIRERIFKQAWKSISRTVVKGLPQWYKDFLVRTQFEG